VGLTEDIAFVRAKLLTFAEDYYRMGVASNGGDAGVPPDMFDGDVNDDGWVEWRMLPSTIADSDVSEMESEFAIQLPPLFRAYLLAGFQLFDQVHSSRYDQLIFNTDVPSNNPLGPIR
jgi:hypothetical protein